VNKGDSFEEYASLKKEVLEDKLIQLLKMLKCLL